MKRGEKIIQGDGNRRKDENLVKEEGHRWKRPKAKASGKKNTKEQQSQKRPQRQEKPAGTGVGTNRGRTGGALPLEAEPKKKKR